MNDLISMVSKFAPAIGTALGGPLGGMAVSALAKQFGVADEVAAVTKAIQADPEAALKLKQLEYDKFTAILADKNSAREREMAIASSANIEKKHVTTESSNIFHLFFQIMFTSIGPTIGAIWFEASPIASPVRLSPISAIFFVVFNTLFSSITEFPN